MHFKTDFNNGNTRTVIIITKILCGLTKESTQIRPKVEPHDDLKWKTEEKKSEWKMRFKGEISSVFSLNVSPSV